MSTFHVEVMRDGPFWLINVVELNISTQVQRHGDVAASASRLVAASTGEADGQIQLVLWSERDCVKIVADGLGFELDRDVATRTDSYSRWDRSVLVRFDEYDAVAEVQAAGEVAAFQPTVEGASAALEFRPGDPGWALD